MSPREGCVGGVGRGAVGCRGAGSVPAVRRSARPAVLVRGRVGDGRVGPGRSGVVAGGRSVGVGDGDRGGGAGVSGGRADRADGCVDAASVVGRRHDAAARRTAAAPVPPRDQRGRGRLARVRAGDHRGRRDGERPDRRTARPSGRPGRGQRAGGRGAPDATGIVVHDPARVRRTLGSRAGRGGSRYADHARGVPRRLGQLPRARTEPDRAGLGGQRVPQPRGPAPPTVVGTRSRAPPRVLHPGLQPPSRPPRPQVTPPRGEHADDAGPGASCDCGCAGLRYRGGRGAGGRGFVRGCGGGGDRSGRRLRVGEDHLGASTARRTR